MQNCWSLSGSASVFKPPSPSSGEAPLPPPSPPDPPDPHSPLPLNHYPSLSEAKKKLPHSASCSNSPASPSTTDVVMTQSHQQYSFPTGSVSADQKTSSTSSGSEKQILATVNPLPKGSDALLETFTVLPPRSNSPLLTNGASSQKNLAPSLEPSHVASAPVDPMETSSPHPKGADLHKNFIVCYFNGRAPPFNQIQSVLNHLWGKGRKLEIHNNPLNHSAVVRIQSEYLRGKILEKNIWYVGDSMFHTAQWTAGHTASTPPLRSIKLWAHLTGIPLDLRHQEGLSWVAGLVGDPKETDDFTLNMFTRQSGEVVEVQVEFPWLPSTCSHCHELGHVVRNCLTYTPPPPVLPADGNAEKSVSTKGKSISVTTGSLASPSPKAIGTSSRTKQYVPKKPNSAKIKTASGVETHPPSSPPLPFLNPPSPL
ncbi:DUF4283 domain-containing protein [Raphanus sativus]|nr:DUF4283 domain-containing protein [Raphanus sativus]